MRCRNKPSCRGVAKGKKCPGVSLADRLAPEFGRLIADYHGRIWGREGAIPLKYKYLMALATAVTGREPQRALLEANKAIVHGATADAIRETLELAVWLGGSPLLLEIVGPVLRFLEARLAQPLASCCPP